MILSAKDFNISVKFGENIQVMMLLVHLTNLDFIFLRIPNSAILPMTMSRSCE